MSNLYLLLRPVRDILDQWLETRDPVHPFTDHTFDKADYVFSSKENYDFETLNQTGPKVEPFPKVDAVPNLVFDPTKLKILERLSNPTSEDNAVFKVEWEGVTRVLKNRHTINDQEADEDRHLTELDTYNHLLRSGLCDEGKGVVPRPCGYFHIWGRQHPGWASYKGKSPYESESWLKQWTNPAEYPRAILLEYIPKVRLPVKQFTTQNIYDLLDTLAKIHTAGVVHRDLKGPNVLWDGARFVIIDFERAVLFEEGEFIEKAGTTPDLHDVWRGLVLHKW